VDRIEIVFIAVIVIAVLAIAYFVSANYVFTGTQSVNGPGGGLSYCTGGPCPTSNSTEGGLHVVTKP
jgi:hypothetical protein